MRSYTVSYHMKHQITSFHTFQIFFRWYIYFLNYPYVSYRLHLLLLLTLEKGFSSTKSSKLQGFQSTSCSCLKAISMYTLNMMLMMKLCVLHSQHSTRLVPLSVYGYLKWWSKSRVISFFARNCS